MMGAAHHIFVSDNQIDLDGRTYLLESALLSSDDTRPASDFGITPSDPNDHVELWFAGSEAFDDLRDEAQRRIACLRREDERASQAAQQELLLDALMLRLADFARRIAPIVPEQTFVTTERAAQILRVDRSTLDDMVARAPRDLPGSPVGVGTGTERRHLRWVAESLPDWMAAYRTWRANRGRKGPK